MTDQSSDINGDPQSDDNSSGKPELVIQWLMRACAQVEVIMSANGKASGHRVKPTHDRKE